MKRNKLTNWFKCVIVVKYVVNFLSRGDKMTNIESWYNDLRNEVKLNKIKYSEYCEQNFADSGITKISFRELVKLSGVMVVLNQNMSENRIKLKDIKKRRVYSKYMPTTAHITYSKRRNPKSDKIGISLRNYNGKLLNMRDLTILLFHEIAHGILHRSGSCYSFRWNCFFRNEIEAQTVSYLVCRYLGLKESFSSSLISYVMTHSKKHHRKTGGKEKRIRKSKIIQTATKIIDCLENKKVIYKEFFKI